MKHAVVWLIVLALIPRLLLAYITFLNPDEALHSLLAAQPSLAAAYAASLTTAHPPLLIVFLHLWRGVAISDFWLRLPSVLAGVGFGYFTFLWLRRVFGAQTAFLGLVLALFLPSLLLLSTEVRQYALLLCFCSASLYFLEGFLEDSAAGTLLLSLATLYLALLTHYSALIFAAAAGVYGLLHLCRKPIRYRALGMWAAGQAVALALAAFLFVSHVSKLKAAGMAQTISETYLRESTFHPGQQHAIAFLLLATLRWFHYLCAQGAIGVLAILLFTIGLWRLFSGTAEIHSPSPTDARLAAVLLLLPFLLTGALAVFGIYPYGGTRHNAILALFAIPAIAVGIDVWKTSAVWRKAAVVLAILLVANVFPAPMGAYIRPKNQSRKNMRDAREFISAKIPANLPIVTDNGGGLLLPYYLCGRNEWSYSPTVTTYVTLNCGGRRIIIPEPVSQDRALAAGLAPTTEMFGLPPGTTVWIFEAGWITSGRKHDASQEIQRLGCSEPRQFGDNILLCPIRLN